MAGIPWARGLDDSAALLLEGYEFGRNRFRQLRSDIFATRLMAQPAIVMMGEEGGGCSATTGALSGMARCRTGWRRRWSGAAGCTGWMTRCTPSASS